MKKNEDGFSAVVIIIVVVIVGLISTVGWLVWDRQKKAPVTKQPTSNTSQATENKSTDTSATPASSDVLKNGEIKKITELSIKAASDIDNLPSYTPASFKDYIRQDFNKGQQGCTDRRYTVNVISLDTIAGSRFNCGEGFNIVWYLDGSSNWNSVSLENACTVVNNSGGDGTKISSTFMKNAMHDVCDSYTDTKY